MQSVYKCIKMMYMRSIKPDYNLKYSSMPNDAIHIFTYNVIISGYSHRHMYYISYNGIYDIYYFNGILDSTRVLII